MKFIISGKNIEVTSALKERITKKLGKLDKFFPKGTEISVTMSVEKTRQILEVTILYNGVVFRSEVASEDMYASIDKSMDRLERQIRKNRTRLEKKLHEDAFKDSHAWDYDIEEEHKFDIVKLKRFSVKPMSTEEAVLQMNLIDHEFFIFSNSDTREVNVVYKRKDGNYGIMEPEN